ncbi:MAG TPA: DinB family protein [Bacteroidota bacterium]|nr:DinB family protein [Bacteroidota bacterium]
MASRPLKNEYADSFSAYVSLVTEADVLSILSKQPAELRRLLRGVTGKREHFRYAPGKWSVREVISHIIDAERVFAYRAFCISRGESTSLPSFDENEYASKSHADSVPLPDLVEEFTTVRKSNMAFLRRLDTSSWKQVGKANNYPVSVRALAYIMAGHVRHHSRILQDRYGV